MKLTVFIFAIREGVNRGFLHRFSVYNCTATKEVQPFKNNLKSIDSYIFNLHFCPVIFLSFYSTISVVNRTLSVFGILWAPA